MMRHIVLLFILSGCIANKGRSSGTEGIAIVSDKNDILEVFTAGKLTITPPKYTDRHKFDHLRIRDIASDETYDLGSRNEEWIRQMLAEHAALDAQINGSKLEKFDLRNIPITFSHKFELDKPRKKLRKKK